MPRHSRQQCQSPHDGQTNVFLQTNSPNRADPHLGCDLNHTSPRLDILVNTYTVAQLTPKSRRQARRVEEPVVRRRHPQSCALAPVPSTCTAHRPTPPGGRGHPPKPARHRFSTGRIIYGYQIVCDAAEFRSNSTADGLRPSQSCVKFLTLPHRWPRNVQLEKP